MYYEIEDIDMTKSVRAKIKVRGKTGNNGVIQCYALDVEIHLDKSIETG